MRILWSRYHDIERPRVLVVPSREIAEKLNKSDYLAADVVAIEVYSNMTAMRVYGCEFAVSETPRMHEWIEDVIIPMLAPGAEKLRIPCLPRKS